MKKLSTIFVLTLLVLSVALVACGSKAATITDIPVYTGAVELQPGQSSLADTLSKNGAQDAAVRQALKTGGSVVQKGFTLPKDATWATVQAFYDDKMKAAGWANGLGGVAGQFVDVNKVLGAANQGNDLFQTTIYSKDKQTLTLIFLTDPTNKDNKQLIFSLASN